MRDTYYKEAEEIVIEHQKCSAAFMQRKLRLGYATIVHLLNMLEKNNIIGPANGSKPRKILKTK